VIVQCEKGYVVIPSYEKATAYNPDGTELQSWTIKAPKDENANDRHFANFFKAIRSGNHEDLNADILEGHLSSALCHTGAISYLLGQHKPAAEVEKEVAGNERWADSYKRMNEHLQANGVDINDPKIQVGPWLDMNPRTEKFVNNPAADKLLTREYRKGYAVPDAGVALSQQIYDRIPQPVARRQ
jgi:hypothetical protein